MFWFLNEKTFLQPQSSEIFSLHLLLYDDNKCSSYRFTEVLGDILHNLIKIHRKQGQICIFQMPNLLTAIFKNAKYFYFLFSVLTCVCVYHFAPPYIYTHTTNAHTDMHLKSHPECAILPSSPFIYHIVL